MDEIEDKDCPRVKALNEEYGWESIRAFPRHRIVNEIINWHSITI